MSTFKVDKRTLPESARKSIMDDIRRFLCNDCEYYWDEKTEMLMEKHPDGTVFRVNFVLTCEREKTIRFSPKGKME